MPLSPSTHNLLWVLIDCAAQQCHLFQGTKVQRSFPVSTAAKGLGEEVNSFKTPRGWHVIAEKIGCDAPDNAVFIAREWTGEIFTQAKRALSPDRDWILTRILWLHGMELGKNRGGKFDTYARHIYCHGSPNQSIDKGNASKGCVGLTSESIKVLYASVAIGTPLFIAETGKGIMPSEWVNKAAEIQATYALETLQYVD